MAAALWPEHVRALVSITGYNIQHLSAAGRPASAAQEHRHWYQWYFNTERGRAGLQQNRRDICRLLWQLWSPNWRFDNAMFEATAASFDNPDFVAVTIRFYRHRYGNAPGDPALEPPEQLLAERPTITVPTIALHGACDGVEPAEASARITRGSWSRWQQRVRSEVRSWSYLAAPYGSAIAPFQDNQAGARCLPAELKETE